MIFLLFLFFFSSSLLQLGGYATYNQKNTLSKFLCKNKKTKIVVISCVFQTTNMNFGQAPDFFFFLLVDGGREGVDVYHCVCSAWPGRGVEKHSFVV